mgnify:CR=1 FL=1
MPSNISNTRTALTNTNCHLPAVITAYDKDTQKATVKPTVILTLRDNTELELPVIYGVPVMMMGTSSSGLQLPVAVGDSVALMFFDRSLDRLLSTDSKVPRASGDFRNHDYNDAVALVGLSSYSEALGTDDNLNLVMNSSTEKECIITMTPNGSITTKTPQSTITQDGSGSCIISNSKAIITIDPLGNITLKNGKSSISLGPDGGIEFDALSTLVKGNFDVELGASGVATPFSTVTFVNGIAVNIT